MAARGGGRRALERRRGHREPDQQADLGKLDPWPATSDMVSPPELNQHRNGPLSGGDRCPAGGRTRVQTTARYAHLAGASMQNATSRITESIGQDLRGEPGDRMLQPMKPAAASI